MPLRLPEPGTFENLLTPVLVSVSSMVRLSRQPDTEPWFGAQARYRFDDALPVGSHQFGGCYAGDSLETAFAESVIHSGTTVPFRAGQFLVPLAELTGRWKVSFDHPSTKRLRLVDLTGAPLKTLGLNNDISAGDDYTVSQQWSRAIHDCNITWDGIRYVSRQLH